ncbi:MAG TPA: hypothetical protein VKZ73_02650, partial [Microbacterium sp.]|nr:hypothetical protein [Microbacterium sp.]
MNLLADALSWLADPSHWQGSGGIPLRIGQHLLLTALALVIASIIALPAGALLAARAAAAPSSAQSPDPLAPFRRSACSLSSGS